MSYLLIKNTLLFSTKLCYPNSFLEMFLMFLKGEIADKQCHPKHFCEGMTHVFLTDEGEKLAPSLIDALVQCSLPLLHNLLPKVHSP